MSNITCDNCKTNVPEHGEIKIAYLSSAPEYVSAIWQDYCLSCFQNNYGYFPNGKNSSSCFECNKNYDYIDENVKYCVDFFNNVAKGYFRLCRECFELKGGKFINNNGT